MIIFYSLLFFAMLALMFVGGKYIGKMQAKTVKRINQISFGVAVASGLLLYIFKNAVFEYTLLAAVISFFMFFNYREKA